MFDPYHRWLSIPPGPRPPSFYQLLGLSAAEDDREVIEEAALRQASHVRTYQAGPHAEQARKILNEIGQARATLTNPDKRKDYDARLGTVALEPAPAPPPTPPPLVPPLPLPPPLPPPVAVAVAEAREVVATSPESFAQMIVPAVGYALVLVLGAGLAFWLSLGHAPKPSTGTGDGADVRSEDTP